MCIFVCVSHKAGNIIQLWKKYYQKIPCSKVIEWLFFSVFFLICFRWNFLWLRKTEEAYVKVFFLRSLFFKPSNSVLNHSVNLLFYPFVIFNTDNFLEKSQVMQTNTKYWPKTRDFSSQFFIVWIWMNVEKVQHFQIFYSH